MSFTTNTTFNMYGCPLHSASCIQVNQSLSNRKKAYYELLNNLTDNYEQIIF